MSVIGAPLPSATYAGYDNAYYAQRNAGGQIVGVENLNGLIGNLAITGDTSIGITKPGLGAIQVSTAGLPQVPSSVACTGAISGTNLTLTEGITAAGGVNAGNSQFGTVAASGQVSSTNFLIVGGGYAPCVVSASGSEKFSGGDQPTAPINASGTTTPLTITLPANAANAKLIQLIVSGVLNNSGDTTTQIITFYMADSAVLSSVKTWYKIGDFSATTSGSALPSISGVPNYTNVCGSPAIPKTSSIWYIWASSTSTQCYISGMTVACNTII